MTTKPFIDSDSSFDRKNWILRDIGRVFLTILIILALVGIVSPSPLARETFTKENYIVHTYPFIHRQAPFEVEIKLEKPFSPTLVSMKSDYLQKMSKIMVFPEPERVISGGTEISRDS